MQVEPRSDLIFTTFIIISMLHYDKLKKSNWKSLNKVICTLGLYCSVKKSFKNKIQFQTAQVFGSLFPVEISL